MNAKQRRYMRRNAKKLRRYCMLDVSVCSKNVLAPGTYQAKMAAVRFDSRGRMHAVIQVIE